MHEITILDSAPKGMKVHFKVLGVVEGGNLLVAPNLGYWRTILPHLT